MTTESNVIDFEEKRKQKILIQEFVNKFKPDSSTMLVKVIEYKNKKQFLVDNEMEIGLIVACGEDNFFKVGEYILFKRRIREFPGIYFNGFSNFYEVVRDYEVPLKGTKDISKFLTVKSNFGGKNDNRL